ncbi:hypothetical protein JBE27_55535, partial [Streptomyces albiflaviniger]|nr:hypothetical protein [Streptomyces albiflaviniger]
FKRFTPDDYEKRTKAVLDTDEETSRRSAFRKMRGDKEEDDDFEEDADAARRSKIISKRGRGKKK